MLATHRPILFTLRRSLSQSANKCQAEQQPKRLLRVALVGAPNAGKSTLLNRLVLKDISCVSKKVHTTRNNILGCITHSNTQLVFLDTPGLVKRAHTHRHRLETSMVTDPAQAVNTCDMIAVVVDASNIREQKRLNKGVLKILAEHPDKGSILILNKVDLVEKKLKLIDIGIRLTQGCIEGKCSFSSEQLAKMPLNQLLALNLVNNLEPSRRPTLTDLETKKPPSRYVIELEPKARVASQKTRVLEVINPGAIGHRNFSRIFSISALQEDGVDELRDHMMLSAPPVDEFAYGSGFVTNLNTKAIVHEIIRGKVMDEVDKHVPYMLNYKYQQCFYDEMGSLNVILRLICPHSYMRSMILGTNGSTMVKIIESSRDKISLSLMCDVNLRIAVELDGEQTGY